MSCCYAVVGIGVAGIARSIEVFVAAAGCSCFPDSCCPGPGTDCLYPFTSLELSIIEFVILSFFKKRRTKTHKDTDNFLVTVY
jgi:hypothetical protein